MRVAILQFGPHLGRQEANLARASALVQGVTPGSLDLLVLPELAFSGYNFPDLATIQPFLEHTAAGPSTEWAQRTAIQLRCTVIVGYPEITSDGKRYNSTVMVQSNGEVTGEGYRKSFLYYTDETWALEGSGFKTGLGVLEMNATEPKTSIRFTQGICMDLNPYAFKAPWDKYEFANHVVQSKVDMAVLSMAWLSEAPNLSSGEIDPDPFASDDSPIWSHIEATKPHLETLSYWIQRFTPLISLESFTIIVLANRRGRERKAIYAGSSCVLKVGRGRVLLYAIMGRDTEDLMQVDTDEDDTIDLMWSGRDEDEPLVSGGR